MEIFAVIFFSVVRFGLTWLPVCVRKQVVIAGTVALLI